MIKRIAQITDAHIDDKTALERGGYPRRNLEAILEHIANQNVNEIIFTGDIGEKAAYEWFFEKLEQLKTNFKIILGNHDDFDMASRFYDTHTSPSDNKLYYTNEDENYKYIYLDSSDFSIDKEQFKWLAEMVNTTKHIILFIHHPILGLKTGMDRIYPLNGRDEIKRLLQDNKNKVTVFCGHYHMPDEREDGNIKQYITPSIAFQVEKESNGIDINTDSFGYRIITIDNEAVTSKLVRNFNGKFISE